MSKPLPKSIAIYPKSIAIPFCWLHLVHRVRQSSIDSGKTKQPETNCDKQYWSRHQRSYESTHNGFVMFCLNLPNSNGLEHHVPHSNCAFPVFFPFSNVPQIKQTYLGMHPRALFQMLVPDSNGHLCSGLDQMKPILVRNECSSQIGWIIYTS